MLDRLRYGRRLTFDQYLAGLASLDTPSAARMRSRPAPGGAPFDLIAGRASGILPQEE